MRGTTHTSRGVLNKLDWPPGLVAFIAVLVMLGLSGPNWLLATLSIGVLIAGTHLLWRPGEVPVMLFVFGYQWLQASTRIFHANWVGQTVDVMAEFPGDVQSAIFLSLLTCLVLALGMRIGAGRWHMRNTQFSNEIAYRKPIVYWFYLYASSFIVATIIQSFAWVVSGLAQPLLALAQLKWAFFWILAYVSFTRPDATKKYLLAAFLLELVLGLGGYFSGFKQVFFYTMLALVASGIRFTSRRKLLLLIFAVIVLSLGVVWSVIKTDYRDYISGGSQQQVILVSPGERAGKLAELVGDLDGASIDSGVERLLERFSYIDFFGVVLVTVPGVIPHENGALWWEAVTRPFMPRLFFPDKATTDDSVLLNRYTGLGLAGADRGTSISLGLPAESYIDFGQWGMFLPLFILGFFAGRIYRSYLHSPATLGPLGMGLSVVVLFPLAGLETSVIKLISAIILPFLASWLVVKFFAPRFFPWVLWKGKKQARR